MPGKEVGLRKLLFLVALLIALLLGVEVGMTMLSQRGLAMALRGRYGLPEKLEARINSFPLLVSLARNHLAELQLRWEGDLSLEREGGLDMLPCEGNVRLYDVELDIPALLKGGLELRSISRLEASLALERGALAAMMGVGENEIWFESGRICLAVGGKKMKYRVKVQGDRTLALEEVVESSGGSGSGSYTQPSIYTFEFTRVPMEGNLRTASVSGDRMLVEISIPMWEGYL